MSTGDPWLLPCRHKAIEMQGSTDDTLQLRVIKPPWLGDLLTVPRVLCQPLRARYYGGADDPRQGPGQDRERG